MCLPNHDLTLFPNGLPLQPAPRKRRDLRQIKNDQDPADDLIWRRPLIEHKGIALYPVYKGSSPLMYAVALRPIEPSSDWPCGVLLDMRDLPVAIRGDAFARYPTMTISERMAHQARVWSTAIDAGVLPKPE